LKKKISISELKNSILDLLTKEGKIHFGSSITQRIEMNVQGGLFISTNRPPYQKLDKGKKESDTIILSEGCILTVSEDNLK
jgi:hypothetical protein